MVTPRKLYTKKPYRPSDEDRAKAATAIAKMVVANIDQDMIAKVLGISRETLRKYYRRELDTSYAIILAEVAGNVVTVARNPNHRDFAKMAQ